MGLPNEEYLRTNLKIDVYFSGEGNGNPLQYSCLENPRTVEPGRKKKKKKLMSIFKRTVTLRTTQNLEDGKESYPTEDGT